MGRWSLDIGGWSKRQGKKIADTKKEFAYLLYSKIVERTPVDTGRARGNWNVSAGHMDASVSERTEPQIRSVSQMPDALGDESYFISNNLPYIGTLEYGGYPENPKGGKGKTVNGFSKQAPKGMVGVTLVEAERYLRRAVNESGQ